MCEKRPFSFRPVLEINNLPYWGWGTRGMSGFLYYYCPNWEELCKFRSFNATHQSIIVCCVLLLIQFQATTTTYYFFLLYNDHLMFSGPSWRTITLLLYAKCTSMYFLPWYHFVIWFLEEERLLDTLINKEKAHDREHQIEGGIHHPQKQTHFECLLIYS